MKKFLLFLLVAVAAVFATKAATISFKFDDMGSTGWGSGYAAHNYEPTDGEYSVAFSAASKQSGTITDVPVSKAGTVTVSLKDGKTFGTAKFNFKQWGSKAETTELKYSTNGTTFNSFSTAVKSTTFTNSLEATTIPSDVVAIQLTLTGTNQIGIASFEYTLAGAAEDTREEVTLAWSAETTTANVGEAFNAPTLSVTPEGAREFVTYESSKPAVAAVAADGTVEILARGTTTITASFAGNDSYKPAKAVSYDLTVADPNATAPTWVRVTSAAELNGDDTYIIAGLYYGALYAANSNATAVKILDGVSSLPEEFEEPAEGYHTFSFPANGEYVYVFDTTESKYYGGSTNTTISTSGKAETTNDYKIAASWNTNGKLTLVPKAATTRSFAFSSGTTLKNYATSNLNSSPYSYPEIYRLDAGGKKPAGLSFAQTSYVLEYGDAFTAPAINNPKGIDLSELTWSCTSEPAGAITVDEQGNVTIAAAGKATVTATYAGNEQYSECKINYNIEVKELASAKSIAELKALESDTYVRIDFDMTVAFVNGGNVFATDGADWIQIYQYNSGLAAGDILPAGWKSTYTLYNGNTPELTNSTLPAVTEHNAEIALAEYADELPGVDNVNEVLWLKNVTIAEATPSSKTNFDVTFNGAEAELRNNYSLASVAPGIYDVKVLVTVFNGEPSYYVLEYKFVSELVVELSRDIVWTLNGVALSDPNGDYTAVEGQKLTVYCEAAVSIVLDMDDSDYIEEFEGNTATFTFGHPMEMGELVMLNAVITLDGDDDDLESSRMFAIESRKLAGDSNGFDFTVADPYGMTSTNNSGDYESKVYSISNNGIDLTFTGDKRFRSWQSTGPVYDLRMYSPSTITLAAPAGFVITDVEFTKGQKTDFSCTSEDAAADETNSRKFTANAPSAKFSFTGTSVIGKILVTLKHATPKAHHEDFASCVPTVTVPDKEEFAVGDKIVITPAHATHRIAYRMHTRDVAKANSMMYAAAEDAWTIPADHVAGTPYEYTITTIPSTVEFTAVDADGNHNGEVMSSFYVTESGVQTGVENIAAAQEEEAEYYNLQGLRVSSPAAGQVYLRSQTGKVVKVRL